MKLRPYQNETVNSVIEKLTNNKSTLVVLPTGAGKTVCFAHLCKHYMQHGRVMVIAHREELIRQAASKIEQITGYRPSIEMASEYSDEMGFAKPRIVVSSVQTLVTGRMMRFDPSEFSLVITDEAHHCCAASYAKVYDHILSNKAKHLGVTATPDRADEQALGKVFDTVAFDYELPAIIEDGWLVPIKQSMVMIEGLDYSRAKTTAGDLNQADVASAQANEHILHEMISPIIEIAGTRKTIVFATPGSKKPDGDEDGFHIAERMTEILNRHKPNSARRVSQDTPKPERRQMLQDFAEGRFQFLVNVGVLTEGFDDPTIKVVAITRPTKSRSLYSQMIGRGTRPLPGIVDGWENKAERKHAIKTSDKDHIEVLDFVGNSGRHKLVTTADILGGKYDDEVVDRAKKKAEESDEAVDMAEVLEEAKDEIHQERKAKARAAIIARAKFTVQNVDPFDVFDLEPMREREWNKGKPPTQAQCAALQKAGIPVHPNLTMTQAGRLLSEEFRRRDAGLVGFRALAAGADKDMTVKELNQDRFKMWSQRFAST
jgi:hypothetical protein